MKKILNTADKGTKDALCILLVLFAIATVIAKCVEPLQTVKAVDYDCKETSQISQTRSETTSQI